MAGRTVAAINKIGWPGAVDDYRVDFQVPDGTPPGMVPLRLSCGWIPSVEVMVAVQ
jgi:hypothetical protein